MNTCVIAIGIATAWLVPAQDSDAPIQPGVAYVFFNQSSFQRPADSGIQPDIRMQTQGVDLGWLWLGKIRFPQTAEVTLSAEADDGLRLFLGDTLVIDGPHASGTRRARYAIGSGNSRDGQASAVRGEPLVMHAPDGAEADNSSIYQKQPPPARDAQPIQLNPGPHLFLDEYLIDESHNLQRRVNRPQRDPQIRDVRISAA